MRPISQILRFKGQLQAKSAVHVGGLEDVPDTDLSLARDGLGNFVIPGTSLTGVLRALGDAGDGLQKRLWGREAASGDGGYASLMTVSEAPITGPVTPELRDHVGIDRRTGAAALGIKYDRMVLPMGTRIPLDLRLDVPTAGTATWMGTAPAPGLAEIEDYLVWLIRQLQDGLRIGAAGTRGLGQVALVEVGWSVTRASPASRDGILALLRGKPDNITDQISKRVKALTARREGLRIDIAWKAKSPVMSKSPDDGDDAAADRESGGVKIMPLVTQGIAKGKLRLILPGSGIKGALRSHAERIERTVFPDLAAVESLRAPVADRRGFLDQIAAAPLTASLFGSTAPRGTEPPKPGVWEPGRGALSVLDCLSKSEIDAAEIEALRRSSDLSKRPNAALDVAYHVAVDRWTGGASDRLLFSAVRPDDIEWHDIQLRIDETRLPPAGMGRDAALALLVLLMRDLAAGWITLGMGSTRGYGDIETSKIALSGRLDGLDIEAEIKPDGLSGAPSLLERLQQAWTSVVSK